MRSARRWARPGRARSSWSELSKGIWPSIRNHPSEARATGNLGSADRAILLAKQGYSAYPTTEAAREVARWLARSGNEHEAVEYLADAFALIDPRNGEADRAADRARIGELYRKLHG